jgi:hypothetical protein
MPISCTLTTHILPRVCRITSAGVKPRQVAFSAISGGISLRLMPWIECPQRLIQSRCNQRMLTLGHQSVTDLPAQLTDALTPPLGSAAAPVWKTIPVLS